MPLPGGREEQRLLLSGTGLSEATSARPGQSDQPQEVGMALQLAVECNIYWLKRQSILNKFEGKNQIFLAHDLVQVILPLTRHFTLPGASFVKGFLQRTHCE